MPKISVIVPVYNVGKYVGKCLESILGQTFNDYEAIVVDDGSTDDSSKICDAFAQRDARIKVFHIPNGGVSGALNVGIRHASGEWLYFVDGDDWIEKNALERMMLNVQKNTSIDVLCFNNFVNTNVEERNVAAQERLWQGRQVEILLAATIFPKYIEKKYHTVLPVIRCRWSKLIRKKVVDDNNIFFKPELTLGQDADFCANVFAVSNNVLMTNEYLYHYRSFESSNSNKYREKWTHLGYRISYLSMNEKISWNKDFNEVKSLLILSLVKTMLTRFLCHPKCELSFADKRKILENFLYANGMNISFSFLSILKTLPYYLPFLLLLKYKKVFLLLKLGKVFCRVKLKSSHS